jgi:hypothetical protein
MLVDRSPCSEPFFDPFSEVKRPLISGLCRGFKNFDVGSLFIYVTKVDPKVLEKIKLNYDVKRTQYFGVAALRIKKIHSNHEEASKAYSPSRYVAEPLITQYQPNLAYSREPISAATINSCITGVEVKREGKKAIEKKVNPT